MEYEVQQSKAGSYGKDEKFGGPPSDEQDEAWDYIINGLSIESWIKVRL